MRADGLWHPRLTALITAAGHGDRIVVADAGLPVPAGVETVDLLWRRGEPGFLPVLTAVLAECVVEAAVAATELTDRPIRQGLTDALGPVPLELVPHTELKRRTAGALVIVRTGEATPYANVILHCGVPF
ncbi:D-ribose pyranase [Micromonospora psammae]|uniref:D-ribose pyranase n=1 Tax=Micromonospora sp. CPCC 205556 TaxID=3122398 RepID=UPI002FEE8A59